MRIKKNSELIMCSKFILSKGGFLKDCCYSTNSAGYLGFKNEDEGFIKKIAPIITLLILLVFALSFIGIIVSLGDLF